MAWHGALPSPPSVAIALAALLALGCGSLEPGDIALPPGFDLGLLRRRAERSPDGGGPDGIVFVGSRSEGKVYACVNRDGQHRVHVLASGEQPSGVAFRDRLALRRPR